MRLAIVLLHYVFAFLPTKEVVRVDSKAQLAYPGGYLLAEIIYQVNQMFFKTFYQKVFQQYENGQTSLLSCLDYAN